MPRATVSLAPQLYELKTLPPVDDEEGGWVKMRRMSYGELLASQDMAYQVQMKTSEDSTSDDPEMGVSITRAAIAEFQLKTCVLDHNLEDENGRTLNLSTKEDVVNLDPGVGQELSNLIDTMHDWSKNFPNSGKPSANGSSTEKTTAVALSLPSSTDEPSDTLSPNESTPTS